MKAVDKVYYRELGTAQSLDETAQKKNAGASKPVQGDEGNSVPGFKAKKERLPSLKFGVNDTGEFEEIVQRRLGGSEKDFLKETATCRRFIIQMLDLVEKKKYAEAGQVGMRALKIAERNELFTEQFIVCEQYMLGKGFYGKDFAHVMEKMRLCTKKMQLLASAKMLFYETRRLGLNGVLPCKIQLSNWETAAEKLARQKKNVQSDRLDYYYQLARMHIAFYATDEKKVLQCMLQLNAALARNRIFNEDFLAANVKACTALIKILEGRKGHAQKVLEGLTEMEIKKCAVDDFFVLENIFVSALHCSLPGKLKEIQDALSCLPAIEENIFLKFKWNYFKATALFLEGNYAKAEKSLAEVKFNRKPQCCQEVYSIVLNTMCIVEQNKWEILNVRSEALRKFFYRSAKHFENTDQRLFIICGLMKSLAGARFDFERILREKASVLNLLRTGAGELVWKPYGHELVRFDKWMDGKMPALKKTLK